MSASTAPINSRDVGATVAMPPLSLGNDSSPGHPHQCDNPSGGALSLYVQVVDDVFGMAILCADDANLQWIVHGLHLFKIDRAPDARGFVDSKDDREHTTSSVRGDFGAAVFIHSIDEVLVLRPVSVIEHTPAIA